MAYGALTGSNPDATGASLRSRPALRDGCPVTPPNHSIPPGQHGNPGAAQAPYHGNGRLWTVLYPDGVVRPARRDGTAAPSVDGGFELRDAGGCGGGRLGLTSG
jgi:hypothetical protein